MPRPMAIRYLLPLCAALAALTAAPALNGEERASGDADTDLARAPAPANRGNVPAVEPDPEPAYEVVTWRRSTVLGSPSAGALRGGVQLPAEGREFFTWDPILKRAPNRPWRRWGADSSVRTLLRVLREFRVAHPEAPRIGVGDLSRPRGGDFGARFGLPGHASHQNGLDIDLYYPRLDAAEEAPAKVAQVDRRLSQDLVRRFVAAGAVYVFVGPNTGLRGPASMVQPLPHHDNHLHVRLPHARG